MSPNLRDLLSEDDECELSRAGVESFERVPSASGPAHLSSSAQAIFIKTTSAALPQRNSATRENAALHNGLGSRKAQHSQRLQPPTKNQPSQVQDANRRQVSRARPSQIQPMQSSASYPEAHSIDDAFLPGDDFLQVSESNETEVIFWREGVSVRPTATEVIQGKLSVLRQRKALFLTWLPHNPGTLQEDGTFRLSPDAQKSNALAHSVDRTAYAVHPLPLADVKALRKYLPAFGSHHVVVILSNGLTLPPLFFGQGGVRAFFSALKEHAVLTKSARDPAVFLVNDTTDPLMKSLAALELPDVLLGGVASTASPCASFRQAVVASEVGVDGSIAGSRFGAWGQLARVKQLARDTTSSFFAGQDSSSVMMAAGERCQPPAGDVDSVAAAGEAPLLVAKRRSSSIAPTVARTESLEEDVTGVGTFELLDRAAADGSRSHSRHTLPGPPLSLPDLDSMLGSEGQLVDERHFRKRVFECGCDTRARREAWRFLLGLHPRSASGVRRGEQQRQRALEYEALRAQWSAISDRQSARFAKWRERKSRVEKDVRRTDRCLDFFAGSQNDNVTKLRNMLLSYVMFNFDLGYCQGMSDLAAPMLYVMDDEAEAFWGFESLMGTFESNFNVDGTGMHCQLAALRKLVEVVDPGLATYLADRGHSDYYFTFRWLLVQFKREVSFEEVLRLWEALWAAPVPHFHMWCVLAVLQQHRVPLMASADQPDGPLRFCIKLQGTLDVESLLRDAALLADYAGDEGACALDSLGTTHHRQIA